MAIGYDTLAAEFVFIPDECPDCESEMLTDTGCDAAGCPGRSCVDCGWGCDIDQSDTGRCATALADEDEEIRAERFDAERAAFGLAPLGGSDAQD